MTNNDFGVWHQYIADQCAVSSKLILDRREPVGFHADVIAPIPVAKPPEPKVAAVEVLTPEQCRDFWGM